MPRRITRGATKKQKESALLIHWFIKLRVVAKEEIGRDGLLKSNWEEPKETSLKRNRK